MKTRLRGVFLRINGIKFVVFFSLLTSTVLAILIFLRLQDFHPDWVNKANVTFYFLNYHGGSIVALCYLGSVLSAYSNQIKTLRSPLILLLPIATFGASLVLILYSVLDILPEYLALIIPVLLAYVTYNALLKLGGNFQKTKRASAVALLLVIAILLPFMTAFACEHNVLSQAANIVSPMDKVQSVARFVQNIPTFNVYRSNDDFWKYVLVGTGACHETAMATVTLLNNLGFEARTVVLPGEDHAFVEVKINSTWLVVDPGYSVTEAITRKQRADKRIQEMGAISYVITHSGSSFIELTSFYVPTDTLTIKVTNGNEPLVNAQVFLLHEFRNGTQRLPDADTSFFTDGNGETTFHLGALTYNENAKEYDTCYWIYVNGKNTGYNVTSTGTGITRLVEIDLHP